LKTTSSNFYKLIQTVSRVTSTYNWSAQEN